MSFIYEIVAAVGLVSATHYGPTWVNYIRHIARSGIDISGKWEIIQSERAIDGQGEERKWKTTINLTQVGREIKGEASAVCITDSSFREVVYGIYGFLENNYLDVSFRDRDRSKMSRSIFLLKVVEAGNTLVGYRMFAGVLSDRPRGVACKWRRPGASLPDIACCTELWAEELSALRTQTAAIPLVEAANNTEAG